jgi:hypothetical protein
MTPRFFWGTSPQTAQDLHNQGKGKSLHTPTNKTMQFARPLGGGVPEVGGEEAHGGQAAGN